MSNNTPKPSTSSTQQQLLQLHRATTQNQFRQTNDPLTPRESALTKELKQLRSINSKLTSVVAAIDSVKTNMVEFNNGTTNALIMMNKWSDIISQASFTNEMLNNTDWHPQNDDENDDDEEDDDRRDDGFESQDTLSFQALDKNDDAELELLQRKLMNYELENMVLKKRLEKEVMAKQEKRSTAEEQANKRRRELGLPGGTTPNAKRRPMR